MSTALEITRPAAAPASAAARPPAPLGRAASPALAHRVAARLGNEWLPRAAWIIGRTGRPGLVGLALLLAAVLFLVSTHLEVAADVEALRAELATQSQARTMAPVNVASPPSAMRALPARGDVPEILRQLFGNATRARLAVDTAKYQIDTAKNVGVVRYKIAFAVTGPYPRIRAFIDATLATMPAVALTELMLERKSIADGDVEAQVRMTVYTRSGP